MSGLSVGDNRSEVNDGGDDLREEVVAVAGSDGPRAVYLEAQGGRLTARCPGIGLQQLKRGGGRRGRIYGRSRSSRRRLLRLLNSVDWEWRPAQAPDVYSWYMLSLTYPADYPDWRQAKRHLDALLKRLVRHFERFHVSGFWVVEPQKRGAPHFHLVILCPWLRQDVLARMWQEVIGVPVGTGGWVWLERADRAKRAALYISKYVAKWSVAQLAQEELEEASPSAGAEPQAALAGEELEDGADAEDAPSLDSGAYLTAEDEWTGRTWGVWRRNEVPWAPLVSMKAEAGRWFWDLKRLARHQWAGIGAGEAGWTLFVRDKGVSWLRWIMENVPVEWMGVEGGCEYGG